MKKVLLVFISSTFIFSCINVDVDEGSSDNSVKTDYNVLHEGSWENQTKKLWIENMDTTVMIDFEHNRITTSIKKGEFTKTWVKEMSIPKKETKKCDTDCTKSCCANS